MDQKEDRIKQIVKILQELNEEKIKKYINSSSIYQNKLTTDRPPIRWPVFLSPFPQPICSPYLPASPIDPRTIWLERPQVDA